MKIKKMRSKLSTRINKYTMQSERIPKIYAYFVDFWDPLGLQLPLILIMH